jgi:hypothetical protein
MLCAVPVTTRPSETTDFHSARGPSMTLIRAWLIITAVLMTMTWKYARSLCPALPPPTDGPAIVFNGQPVQGCYRVDLPPRNPRP